MTELLICNGTIIDPSQSLEAKRDLLIRDGLVAEIAESISADGVEVFDATGLIVAPGFIDLHVHLREPGFEYKETIESGARAAVAEYYAERGLTVSPEHVCLTASTSEAYAYLFKLLCDHGDDTALFDR